MVFNNRNIHLNPNQIQIQIDFKCWWCFFFHWSLLGSIIILLLLFFPLKREREKELRKPKEQGEYPSNRKTKMKKKPIERMQNITNETKTKWKKFRSSSISHHQYRKAHSFFSNNTHKTHNARVSFFHSFAKIVNWIHQLIFCMTITFAFHFQFNSLSHSLFLCFCLYVVLYCCRCRSPFFLLLS